jgi:hypothetical protein
VIDLQADEKPHEVFIIPPPSGGKARFAKPGEFDMAEFLNYLDEMSLLLGCPLCRSFNMRENLVGGRKIQVCLDCGHWVEAPPVN